MREIPAYAGFYTGDFLAGFPVAHQKADLVQGTRRQSGSLRSGMTQHPCPSGRCSCRELLVVYATGSPVTLSMSSSLEYSWLRSRRRGAAGRMEVISAENWV